MKVHLKEWHPHIDTEYRIAAETVWANEGLVPDVVKACNGFMVSKEAALTSDHEKITCLHCKKKIQKDES